MGILLSLILGVAVGYLVKLVVKPSRSMQEMVALGATGGVLCGFVIDLATTGSRLLNNATVNSMGAAMFGAVLFILLRRLLVEMR